MKKTMLAAVILAANETLAADDSSLFDKAMGDQPGTT